jgi:hypothetical protein
MASSFIDNPIQPWQFDYNESLEDRLHKGLMSYHRNKEIKERKPQQMFDHLMKMNIWKIASMCQTMQLPVPDELEEFLILHKTHKMKKYLVKQLLQTDFKLLPDFQYE